MPKIRCAGPTEYLFYMSLHYADPTWNARFETDYPGYYRCPFIERKPEKGNVWKLDLVFPACSSHGVYTLTHWAVWMADGDGRIVMYGALAPAIMATSRIRPLVKQMIIGEFSWAPHKA